MVLAGSADQLPVAFTREQALRQGTTVDALRWALTTKRWFRLRRGCYAQTSLWESLDSRARHAWACWAASQWVPDSVVTHRSAAVLHGLPAVRELAPVELTVKRQDRCLLDGVIVHTSRRRLPPHISCDIPQGPPAQCLRVTTVTRTIVDIARTEPLPDALGFADFALRHRLTSVEHLQQELRTLSRWPGAVSAQRVIDLATHQCRDPEMSRARAVLHQHGVAPHQLGVSISLPRQQSAYYDFGWAGRGVVAWLDRDDGTPVDTLQHLRDRLAHDDQVREQGWVIVRMRVNDLLDRPEATIRHLLHYLERDNEVPEDRRSSHA